MSERDIPSVPVTTLSGLTSLSDLLSELPVSETLGTAATSLKRTLLFHTLVASESKNLLSVRDDNLTKQLVQAIERTNPEKIELKPQYEVHSNNADVNTFPELLQGIYNFRPNVFSKNLHFVGADEHGCNVKSNMEFLCTAEGKPTATDIRATIHSKFKEENKISMYTNESSTQGNTSITTSTHDNNLQTESINEDATQHKTKAVKLVSDTQISKNSKCVSSNCLATNSSSENCSLDPEIEKKPEVKISNVQADFKNVLNMQKELSNSSQKKPQNNNYNPIIISSVQISEKKSPELLKSFETYKNSKLLVRINRIKAEDIRLMRHSIKEFIKKSPEMARKMCLSDTHEIFMCEPHNQYSDRPKIQEKPGQEMSTNTFLNNKVEVLDDQFNIMKAHEKIAQKRKYPVPVIEIPPEQI